MRATKNGHERVARVLAERTSFDPDTAITDHGRMLSWAVANGCEGIVRVFLEGSGLYLDTPNTK